MIKLSTKDKSIKVQLKDKYGVWWEFLHSMKHKSEAKICSEHFDKELEKRISEIREKAYNDGYKDGKHHQKKVSEFCKWIEDDCTGCK